MELHWGRMPVQSHATGAECGVPVHRDVGFLNLPQSLPCPAVDLQPASLTEGRSLAPTGIWVCEPRFKSVSEVGGQPELAC